MLFLDFLWERCGDRDLERDFLLDFLGVLDLERRDRLGVRGAEGDLRETTRKRFEECSGTNPNTAARS